tara:strand:- start:303 stop:776 length:474 start_codon:yes stop_codon:yes gene_type:complete
MVEEIYTYFTIEMIYLWLNIGVLPFWFMLIFFPQSKICKIFISSIFPTFIFTTIYCYLIYTIFKSGYNFLNNFNLYFGINDLVALFSDDSFLILFWIHFLAINLFCGSWIAHDCQKFGISKFLVFIPLIVTYFIGPLGIFLYWIIRIFYAKKINLFD